MVNPVSEFDKDAMYQTKQDAVVALIENEIAELVPSCSMNAVADLMYKNQICAVNAVSALNIV